MRFKGILECLVCQARGELTFVFMAGGFLQTIVVPICKQTNTGAGHTDYGLPMRMLQRFPLPQSGRTFEHEFIRGTYAYRRRLAVCA